MKHIVLGKGNLGQALNRAIYRHTSESCIVSHREQVSEILSRVGDSKDNWIWITEGFGSVGECKNDPYGAFDLHVRKVHEIIHRFPQSNLVFFSTNYVVPPKKSQLAPGDSGIRSEYAISKALMESVINLTRDVTGRTNIWGIRVANLYSKYNPHHSFAGRLLSAKDKLSAVKEAGDVISLPINLMVPTDTDWLADRLMDNYQGFKHFSRGIFDMGPVGEVTTKKFGEIVTGLEFSTGQDNERPYAATLDDQFPNTKTWYEVWNSAREYRRSLNLSEITPDQL